jgi:hypothetical protein
MGKDLLKFLLVPGIIGLAYFPQQTQAQCTPPSITTHKDSVRCGPGTVMLLATPSSGVINWYSSATGGSLLATGNSFVTPSISNTTSYYAAASAGSGGLTNGSVYTTNVGGNGCNGGVMFNITPTVNITVDSFQNLAGSSGAITVTVYYKTGTYVGSELTAGNWTTAGTANITTTTSSMSTINVGAGINMTAGTTYGIFIANMYSTYTNGTGSNQTYTNADLTLFAGAGLCGVFTSTVNDPRVFNGTVYYHKGSGCESNRLAVTATVKPTPTVNIGNDTTICPGISYTFNAGNPGATYNWSTGATTQTITTNAVNNYYVTVTGTNSCKGSDTITITPGVAPVNNLPATTNLCSGDTATLNAGNTGSTFVWTPGGSTSQNIQTTAAGNYSVAIKSINGCKLTSNTNLVVRPLPVANLGNDTSICDGASIMLNAGNPSYTHLWSNGSNTQTISASDSGTYTVVTTTPYSCTLTDEEHIAYLPSPRVEGFNFVPEFYDNLGKVQFYPLNPTNVYGYQWDFGDNAPLSNQMNPLHDYAASGDYNVTVKVSNGCGDFELSQLINVDLPTGVITLKNADADIRIFPNPTNNILTIENKTKDTKMQQVAIFNTLGAMVYKQDINSTQQQLSVSNFAAGMYSIRILTDKGLMIKKFEVMK